MTSDEIEMRSAPPLRHWGAVVEALDEIAYVTDLQGTIISLNPAPWANFANANDSPELAAADAVVGRPLESFFSGAPVVNQFKVLFAQVASGERDHIRYPYRCDAPESERAMRLCMSAIRDESGTPQAVLFQTVLLSEVERTAFNVISTISKNNLKTDLPVQSICSYCKRLEWPAESGNWLEVEEYDAAGGSADVRLSHGACEPCVNTVLAGMKG